ncbi:histidine kinase [Bacillus sp. 3255]|uniref:sensor histidine kinase n=1 Tax=Bacillus sp. 3255 TaxID=2817904 RepID=UPI002854EB9F|nr:histidine kinase [Bacillus sp. 3255]MDR6881270.1 two-component system sensor histidine kinase YesM [Bacillus sp. 3255]
MLTNKFRSLSIIKKLVLLIILFMCVPFFLFGYFWYSISAKTAEQNAIAFSDQLLRQTSEHLNSYFHDLERTTYPLLTHPLIQQFLKIPAEDTYEQIVYTKRIKEELLHNIIFGREDIYNFTVLSKQAVDLSSTGGPELRKRNLRLLDTLVPSQNYKVIGIDRMDATPVLTIMRVFLDALSYRHTGIMLIDLNLNEIDNICGRNRLGDTGFLWAVDRNGVIVCHPDKTKWGQKAAEEELKPFQSTSGSFKKGASGSTLVTYYRSDKTGLVLISEVPLQEMNRGLNALRNMTIVIGIILAALIFTSIGAFAFSLTRSLRNLQRLMKRAEIGDLSVSAPEQPFNSELDSVNRSFNKMVNEIRRLIEVVHRAELRQKDMQIRQRESVLQAMQSQINPHFLYNTLEIINSYAIVQNIMPISRMSTALAAFFRYSVNGMKPVVTLREELNHIRTYMLIQQERYRRLDIEIDLEEEEAEHVSVVRLTLQPLVENVFVHGYERHRLRPSYVGIFGKKCVGYYSLKVLDRGLGMDGQLMAQYNQAFQGSIHGSDDSSDLSPFQRIGMWNVHARLAMHFGETYGLRIERSDESGTVLEIRLPIKEHESHVQSPAG